MFHDEISISVSMVVLKDYICLDMVLQILLRQIDFGFFSHGCREEDCPRNICPDYFVLDNGDSFSRLPMTSTKLYGCLSLKYQWWYSCRCWLITLMAMCVHKVLPLQLKIKIMGEPSLVFTGLWFGIFAIILRLPLEKYKIMSEKKKGLEDLEDFLISFCLYFVIAVVSSCIYTMYYLPL